MGTTDLLIAAAILAAAGALLVRTVRRSAGGCHGCEHGCAARPGAGAQETPGAGPGSGVVRIGAPRRAAPHCRP